MKWTPADKRRRWFGLFFLIMAIGLFIWGQTILKPHLTGLTYVCYWLLCFLLTIMAMLTAMLDVWVVRLRQRRSEREAAQQTLGRSLPKRSESSEDNLSESP